MKLLLESMLDYYDEHNHEFVVPMVMWSDQGGNKVRTAVWLFDNPPCAVSLWSNSQGHSKALQVQALTLASESDLTKSLTPVLESIVKVNETRFDRGGLKIRVVLCVSAADNKCGWVLSGMFIKLFCDVDFFINRRANSRWNFQISQLECRYLETRTLVTVLLHVPRFYDSWRSPSNDAKTKGVLGYCCCNPKFSNQK